MTTKNGSFCREHWILHWFGREHWTFQWFWRDYWKLQWFLVKPSPLNVFWCSDHWHQWFFNGFWVVLPLVSMVFNGQGPLVERWNGFNRTPHSIHDALLLASGGYGIMAMVQIWKMDEGEKLSPMSVSAKDKIHYCAVPESLIPGWWDRRSCI